MNEQPTIWLVDDDQAIIEIIKQAFKKQQLSCQIAGFTDANAIIANLEKAKLPTMLMVDYSMPGMDGLELIERIKHNPNTAHLKLFYLANLCPRS